VLRVNAELSGRRVKCPACQQFVLVPRLAEEPAEPEPLLPRRRSPAAGRSRPVWPFIAIPAGVLAVMGIVVLWVVNSGKRERATQPPVEQAAPAPVPVKAIEPVVEAKPAAKLAPPPIPGIERLKANDPEASDTLRRALIPPYELKVAGRGDSAAAPPHLITILGDSRLKHWTTVSSMAFSRDGTTLWAGSGDGVVIPWDVATGRMRRMILASHDDGGLGPGRVFALALSPDERTLATTSRRDQFVKLWDVATGRERHSIRTTEFPDKIDHYSVLVYSPDGKYLAGGGTRNWDTVDQFKGRAPKEKRKFPWEGLVTLWNTAGRVVWSQTTNTVPVHNLAFTADGQSLVIQIEDQSVMTWNAKTRRMTWSLDGTQRPPPGSARRWSPPNQAQRRLLSPDGLVLTYESSDKTAAGADAKAPPAPWRWAVLDPTTGRERLQPQRPGDCPRLLHGNARGPRYGDGKGTPILPWDCVQRELCRLQPRRPRAGRLGRWARTPSFSRNPV